MCVLKGLLCGRKESEELWKELECVEVEGSVLGSVYKDVFGSESMLCWGVCTRMYLDQRLFSMQVGRV